MTRSDAAAFGAASPVRWSHGAESYPLNIVVMVTLFNRVSQLGGASGPPSYSFRCGVFLSPSQRNGGLSAFHPPVRRLCALPQLILKSAHYICQDFIEPFHFRSLSNVGVSDEWKPSSGENHELAKITQGRGNV